MEIDQLTGKNYVTCEVLYKKQVEGGKKEEERYDFKRFF